MKLFDNYKLGNINLKNRIVMAPMTRSRAIDNIPNELMTEYYAQRATAGLIITEGVAPSANGLGYARIPGIYNDSQIKGWKIVTDAVHAQGGKIFIQLMHTGRISHPDNMEKNTKIIAPSAIAMSGEMYTDVSGMQSYPIPSEMNEEEIKHTQTSFVGAAKNAITAGFDGVELHGANGYLIDQFINIASNQRMDNYGGTKENRSRYAIEVAEQVSQAIGEHRTGIRLSPYGVYNDMTVFKDTDDTFEYLSGELGKLDLAYIHIVDHSSQGAPDVPDSIKSKIQKAFGGNIIASGGMDKAKAELILTEKKGDLIAFGQAFLANPDLINKLKNDLPLTSPNYDTFFTPGREGYIDYQTA